MSLPLERLEAEALELTTRERAHLARLLLASLDEDLEEDPFEVERAWELEIQQRMEDYRAGRIDTVPAGEALARIRSRLEQQS
jgi:putative addiction module component (TIGR02574 family)